MDSYSAAKTRPKTHVDQNCHKNVGKLQKDTKFWKMLNTKLVSDCFSENLKINRKPCENDLHDITRNNFSENYRQIIGECSEYFRFFHIIKYLSTGLLVPYREILSPNFFTQGPRKLGPYFKTSGLVFHGTGPIALASGYQISRHWPYSPCIRLPNSVSIGKISSVKNKQTISTYY